MHHVNINTSSFLTKTSATGIINPLDQFMILIKTPLLLELKAMRMAFGIMQPNFIKRRQMIHKGFIRGKISIIEVKIVIRVKKLIVEIIKSGINASAKIQ